MGVNPRSIVVETAPGTWVWVDSAGGWILRADVRQWLPTTDARRFGGSVLRPGEVAALVETFGAPNEATLRNFTHTRSPQ